jgi:hypothetical protein
MRFIVAFTLIILFACLYAHGRSLASIRKDAFTVGVSKSDSAAEYDFISEITAKMKFSRFRLVSFENTNAGQNLLLNGKVDAIISRINHSPHLENKFLVSAPYGKTEIAVATLAKNSVIWTLADLNGKALAFIPKDIANEQILSIWQNSKPIAVQNLNDALNFLQSGQVAAIIANRELLETQKNSALRIFPNNLAENSVVALFAPGSKNLMEEFDNAVNKAHGTRYVNKGEQETENKEQRLNKAFILLNELKKELEILQKELK